MRYIKSFTNDNAIQAAVDDKSLGKPYVALDENTGLIDWNGKDIDYSKMYLTIEALSGGTFYVRKANFGYSVNGGEWETTTGATSLSLNQGDAVRFKGNGTCKELFSGNTMAFNAYGNIESLEYGDNFSGATSVKSQSGFTSCFQNCSKLVECKNIVLPATTLTKYCYKNMFNDCTSLTTAPELPATTLVSNCYSSMFSNCKSLTTAPELPAATLAVGCYGSMFSLCNSLVYIKCKATNMSALTCLIGWVNDVSPTGTFVKKAGVTWSTGVSGIPSGWTVIEE